MERACSTTAPATSSAECLKMRHAKSLRRACGFVFLFMVLAVVFVLGFTRLLCHINDCDEPTLTPLPSIPAELTTLPTRTQTQCSHEDTPLRHRHDVWEYPAINPGNIDKDSAYSGYRGEHLGFINECAEVMVTEYAWSEINGEFWVLVELEPSTNGTLEKQYEVHPEIRAVAESKPTAGWISFRYVEMAHSSAQ